MTRASKVFRALIFTTCIIVALTLALAGCGNNKNKVYNRTLRDNPPP